MQMIGGNDVQVEEGEYIAILKYQHYLNVEALGETNVDK